MTRSICKFSCFLFLSGLLLASSGAHAQMRGGSPMGGQTGSMGGQPGNMGQPGMPANMQQNGSQLMQQNAFITLRRNQQIETDLSKMALKNSSSDNVKKFAQQVITDNRRMERDLVAPDSTGMPAFSSPVPSQTKKAEKEMKKTTGQPFDQMYLVQMDAYVKNDRQTVQGMSSMMDSPDSSRLGMQMRTLSDDRAKQIAQLTKEANFKIE